MSGGQSYPLRSPTAQSAPNPNFPPYSPTQRTGPYYGPSDAYPPQTPPQYATHHPVSHSPHFASAQVSSLPAVNGSSARNTEASSPIANATSSPGYSRPLSYPAQYASGPSSYLNPPSSHSHPPSRQEHPTMSPTRDRHNVFILNGDNYDGFGARSSAQPTSRPVSQEKPARASDPMSFANILSEPAAPRPAPKASSPAPLLEPVSKEPSISARSSLSPVKSDVQPEDKMQVDMQSPAPIEEKQPTPRVTPAPPSQVNGVAKKNFSHKGQSTEPRRTLTDEEYNRVLTHITRIEDTSVPKFDDPELANLLKLAEQKKAKRVLEFENAELNRQKRRRVDMLESFKHSFATKVAEGNDRFRMIYESSAQQDVHDKEVFDEKERKKDMQRKRRREQTIRNELQKKQEAEAKAEQAEDSAERERLRREAEKHRKKIKTTERALHRGNSTQEISEVTAIAPNLEGGTTSSFQVGATESPEPPKSKKKAGGSSRPKKSKEQKQQEKDKAEAAFAAMDKEEPVRIAPKEETRKEVVKKEGKASRSKELTPASPASPYDSKGYVQIYEQIWRDMARKDIPKVYRIKAVSLSTRQENLRKTAQLASKQARKWQERTNKSMKDTQARAKRTMREMMSFWKRNEREERDLRRLAEKKEIEDAKRAEAEREANRQKRKLNFLISQTELYSHFIGRKIKTDEVERATNDPDVAASNEKVQPGDPNAHTVNLPDSVANVNRKVTNFEDLDFDAEDESVLQEAAMANAQNAIQEAQDKARAFNDSENKMAAFDDGELNFQNPTSFGDVQVTQPKMLQAQLKEYQLKGLNWLVNLYEQGINGILADEMGLGKTVQSISVMGYLAEVHNIWGPFLVIAPASTLHNWQQEITKFVPTLKVLPYWGNAKDRKILRKFWDRKHITYTKESEFHVLVTSYQLVVQDAQYFQKVRWQYMILDEAQAIKSSSSSRWKVLLGFHCRNRLLLTGTPIQNNMQELWALLHFIMPTLFDSHDEFSDWFSKDIESHAQSNTKLNQDQLRRLHMILKPFMLRRVKAHVQKELGDKVEKDIFCDLTYRQRAYYSNLRSRISIMDLIEKATMGDDQDTATLMNLVMQFRKVCNHPDLFERAETTSPFALTHFAETASFVREGQNVQVGYSVRNVIEYDLPRILCNDVGRLHIAGPANPRAGFEQKYLHSLMNIWMPEHLLPATKTNSPLSFLRFVNESVGDVCHTVKNGVFERAVALKSTPSGSSTYPSISMDDAGNEKEVVPLHALFKITARKPGLRAPERSSPLHELCNVSLQLMQEEGLSLIEPAARPGASAPPIQISCFDQNSINERHNTLFNASTRQLLYPLPTQVEAALLNEDIDPTLYPPTGMLPAPANEKSKYTSITVPSMRRFVTDSGKLAKLDELLRELKNGGHRVLLYFQMTRMIDLMEEYLTYRNYKYCRLDGSTKLEDRRDTVHDFQTRPEIFIFLLSTRAGGLGINLTSADTVIFYDSDWNPTIDSQAMDRAHRLGQTKQVTVYRMITRGTIEERIRKRALQKEEVQRVVISGGAAGGVDFNTRATRENRTKDIAMWLADDDQAALIEQKEKEAAEKPPDEDMKGKRAKKAAAAAAAPAAAGGLKRKRGEVSMDDLYHEGEGNFGDDSAKQSGAATPVEPPEVGSKRGPRGGRGISKKAKTREQRLQMIDGAGDMGMGT